MKRMNRFFILVCAVSILPMSVAAESAHAARKSSKKKTMTLAEVTLSTNCKTSFKKYRAACEARKSQLRQEQADAQASAQAKARAEAEAAEKAKLEAQTRAQLLREAQMHPNLNQSELDISIPGHHFEMSEGEVRLKGRIPEDCSKHFEISSGVRGDEGYFVIRDQGGHGRDCIDSKRAQLGVDATTDENGEIEVQIGAPVCDISSAVKCVSLSSIKGASYKVKDEGKSVKFSLARFQRGSEGRIEDKSPIKGEDGKPIEFKSAGQAKAEAVKEEEKVRDKRETQRLRFVQAERNIVSCRRDNKRELQVALRDLKVLCNSNRMEIEDCSRLESELGKADRDLRMKEASAQFAELQKQARTAKLDDLADLRAKLKKIAEEFPEAGEKVADVLIGIANRYAKEKRPASEGATLNLEVLAEAKALPGLKPAKLASLDNLEWQARGLEVSALETEGNRELADSRLESIKLDIELQYDEKCKSDGASMEVCMPLQQRGTQLRQFGQSIYSTRVQVYNQRVEQQRAAYQYQVQVAQQQQYAQWQAQQTYQQQAAQAYQRQMYLQSMYGGSYGSPYASSGYYGPVGPVGPVGPSSSYGMYGNGMYGNSGYGVNGYGMYGNGGYGSSGYGGYGGLSGSLQIYM